MKVLMYCLPSISGGMVSYIRNIVPLLDGEFRNSTEGHTLVYLAHEDQRDLFSSVDQKKVIWLAGKRPMSFRREMWEYTNLSKIVRKEIIDVFFNVSQIGPRVPGVKQVMMLQNMEPFLTGTYKISSFYTRLRKYLLKISTVHSLTGADRVIATSQFVREHLKESMKISDSNIRMIYPGQIEFRDNEIKENESKKELQKLGITNQFILTCGSLYPYRRCEDVIAAFNECANDLVPRVQLVIAGVGGNWNDRRYVNFIQGMIANSPFNGRIVTLGFVPWTTMLSIYKNSLLCVFSTEIEACPNIGLEALAAGCAIIAADLPPLPEIFNGSAALYRARDIGDLAEKMRQCSNNEQTRLEMKKRALNRAEAFSWKTCAKETYRALTSWA